MTTHNCPTRKFLSHMERRTRARSRLPPPCGEVGLLSAHARRRPGEGLELDLALSRLDVAQRFKRSPHPARLCAVAQEARPSGRRKVHWAFRLSSLDPHKGEVSLRLALLIDALEPYAIALPWRGGQSAKGALGGGSLFFL